MTTSVLQRLLVLVSILLLMSSFESMGLARILFLLFIVSPLFRFFLHCIVFNSQPVECDGHSIVSMLHWFRTEKSLKMQICSVYLKIQKQTSSQNKFLLIKYVKAEHKYFYITIKNWNSTIHIFSIASVGQWLELKFNIP